MATKTSKTAKSAKVAPKATKTVTTSTGKTKTMPAAKPASKPTPAPKNKYSTGCIIAFIIGVIAMIALVGIVIYGLAQNVSKNDSSMVVEDGDGNKVSTTYTKFMDDRFQIKLPNDFNKLDTEKVKEEYNTEAAEAVYESKDQKANFIIATEDSAKVSNDQIESYLTTMKSVFAAAGKVLKTNYYEHDGHNIATMQVVLEEDKEKFFEELAFFSLDDQLVLFTFSCDDDERLKWQPVSDYIIKSLDFLK